MAQTRLLLLAIALASPIAARAERQGPDTE